MLEDVDRILKDKLVEDLVRYELDEPSFLSRWLEHEGMKENRAH